MSGKIEELLIRPAATSERSSVVALWIRAGLTTSYNDPGADFDLAHGKADSTVLVGLLSNLVVASVMVGHDGHRGWIYYVSVDPDHQRGGHGATIVAAAEAWLGARGVAKVMLLIRESNAPVAAFYERIGYEAAPRIVMQKWISDGR